MLVKQNHHTLLVGMYTNLAIVEISMEEQVYLVYNFSL